MTMNHLNLCRALHIYLYFCFHKSERSCDFVKKRKKKSSCVFVVRSQVFVVCFRLFRHCVELIKVYPFVLKEYTGRVDIIIIIMTYPVTARVVGIPQMISQPVFFSIFPCSPPPSRIWQTPGLPIPRCRLPTSTSIYLVSFPLSLCLARWFWPDLVNRRHDHTTAVCVSLRWSGGLRVVRLPAGSWHRLPRW